MMKNLRKPSISHFGPRSKNSPKMTHGRVRKTRKLRRFVSSRMKKINEEIKKRSNMMRTISVANQASTLQRAEQNVPKIGNDVQPKTMATREHLAPLLKNASKLINSPSMANRDFTSKASANSKNSQVMKDTDAATVSSISNGKLKPLELSRKTNMKQGPIQSSNSIKRNSQENRLKAMPGLVHKTKNRSNLDHEATKGIHCKSGPNVISGMKDKSTMREPLPKSISMHRKRRKYINTNDDIDDTYGHQSDENDSPRVPLDHAALKDSNAKVSTSFVTKCVLQQDYCSKPIDESAWSGLLKTGSKEHIALAGHLSTKSGEKVWNLSKSLRRVVEVTKVCRSEVWPKRWEASRPTSDNIGLYFFPYKMRPDKYHDQLIKEVMENDLALRAAIDEAELLIFPSSLLPEQYQTFQSKHYLWGVFRPNVVKGKHGDESQHAHHTGEPASNATSSVPIDATLAATSVRATVALSLPTLTHTGPTNQGQIDSSMGALPGRVVSFVVRQSPRIEQLIQEMEREGALIVAMQGEMLSGDGSLHRWHGDQNAN